MSLWWDPGVVAHPALFWVVLRLITVIFPILLGTCGLLRRMRPEEVLDKSLAHSWHYGHHYYLLFWNPWMGFCVSVNLKVCRMICKKILLHVGLWSSITVLIFHRNTLFLTSPVLTTSQFSLEWGSYLCVSGCRGSQSCTLGLSILLAAWPHRIKNKTN